MNDLDVDDWYVLRGVANDRLSPEGIAAWFVAVLVYSAIVLLIPVIGYYADECNTLWKIIILTSIILFIINILIIFYYSNSKYMYSKQKLQSVLLCIYGTKLSIDGYVPTVFLIYTESSNKTLLYVALLALIGGIILNIAATIRGVNRAKKGYFRAGQNGLYDFKEKSTKSFMGIYLIYPCVMIGMIIFRSIQNSNFQNSFLLFWVIVVQYAVSLAIPEFYLLMYCKFKYKEFIVEMPEWYKKRIAEKKRARLMKKQRIKESLKEKLGLQPKKTISSKHNKKKLKKRKKR